MEIVELDPAGGAPTTAEPASLSPERSWLRRTLGRERGTRFVLDPAGFPAEILAGRRDFALLELAGRPGEEARPILHVLPGMAGELRIGVSRMSVAQMLADPALCDPELGGARLPLPYGARVRVEIGPRVFVARVGGPPLVQRSLPAASSQPRLAHA